jgi:hypothetical protein
VYIDKTGSDITPFQHFFVDGKGEFFRHALSYSFAFAFNTLQLALKISPNHKLDLWDQAVQYKLEKINNSRKLFVDGVKLYTEKKNSKEVWNYGISITKSQKQGQRLWILPDALIKTSSQTIAIEFDHGPNLGKWANQLIKAARSLASNHISGVLYCFCLEKDLHPLGYLLDSSDDFTEEFQQLLQASLSKKDLGIITIQPCEWQNLAYDKKEAVDFFESAYALNKKMSQKSRIVAEQILIELRKNL